MNYLAYQLNGLDRFAILMIGLVVFIGSCVYSFAVRYMKGDSNFRSFSIKLLLLIISVSVIVSTNNIKTMFVAWCSCNILLILLMIHKSNWNAAYNSGLLAAKNYLLGAICIGAAFVTFYFITGETNIRHITALHINSNLTIVALSLIVIGVMTQSAIWPFHRWLISSLNSPTPVSAIMHAGLVNGGLILIVRFAPLYLQQSKLLNIIFAAGIITAFIGTLYKLMQSDVKRMLACSTMGQMGFMLAQCGLGLIAAAIAHLVWHSMFKAYLFLASGSAAQEKRLENFYPPKTSTLLFALLCGFSGSLGFAYVTNKSWLAADTTVILMVIATLAGIQFAIPLLRVISIKTSTFTLVATTTFGIFYGLSVQVITWIVEPLQLMHPQPINSLHVIGILVLILSWITSLFLINKHKTEDNIPEWQQKLYVSVLNASQPHPLTVTALRNHYKY